MSYMFDCSKVILVGSPVVSCSRVVEYRTCNRKVIGSTPVGELGFSFPKYACDTDKKKKDIYHVFNRLKI